MILVYQATMTKTGKLQIEMWNGNAYDWNQKNAIRIYAKYTQETLFFKYEMVSTQMSGMWAGLIITIY